MKKLTYYQLFSSKFLKFCFPVLFLILMAGLLFASDPIQIATTNSANALAFSNSRKIVRTSADKLVVIYQDSSDSGPYVNLIYSDDGVNWITLAHFNNSTQPALAIGPNDEIYACWVDGETKDIAICPVIPDTSADPIIPTKIWISWQAELQHPALEVTNNSVNLVYQVVNGMKSNIQFERFSKDSQQINSSFVDLSVDVLHFLFPVIVGDLYFSSDLTFMFWSDINPQSQMPMIRYASMEEHIYPDSTGGVLLMGDNFPFSNIGISSASLSAATNTLIVAMVPPNKSYFITSMLEYSPSGFETTLSDTIYVSQDPMPSVDDVYIQSCAVCWRDSNTIYYSQNYNGKFLFDPIPVSARDVNARQPSVCYKTFRQKIFDVVWLEGDTPPFRIMYRRMDKIYSPVNVDEQKAGNLPGDYVLFQNYPNPFNPETEVRYQLAENSSIELTVLNVQGQRIKKLFSGQQAAGTHQIKWDGLDENGNPVASGIYLCQMRASKFVASRKMLLLK